MANGRLVHVDDSYGSGDDNPGNVIVQRLGPSRYASYLHGKAGSYIDPLRCGVALRAAGAAMEHSSVGFDRRGAGGNGRYRRRRGRLPSAFLRHDGARSPRLQAIRVGAGVVPQLRNVEQPWLPLDSVANGVPRAGQRLRRQGTQGSAAINFGAAPNGFGALTAVVKLAGPGRPASNGVITLTVMSAWGEALKSQTLSVGNTSVGPWMATITGVPAYKGLKVVATYSGAWNIPTCGGSIGGESNSFSLPADTSTIVTVDLKVGQVPK